MIYYGSVMVVDTNVPVMANGQASQASLACVLACTLQLEHIVKDGCILIDDQGIILAEYARLLNFSGQPGPGDAFFKWLFENQANDSRCRRISVQSHPQRGFVEFPSDDDLKTFDPRDRKFVAVALASGSNPKILNAADSDWWHHRHVFSRLGVGVVFLCPALMRNRVRRGGVDDRFTRAVVAPE